MNRLGQYFKLFDNSTEFVCEWCNAEGFHLRGKLIVNLCCGCETLHITNNGYCNEINEAIRIKQIETEKIKLKNIIIHPPEYYENKLNEIQYSEYLKKQEMKNKVKRINPIKLKH